MWTHLGQLELGSLSGKIKPRAFPTGEILEDNWRYDSLSPRHSALKKHQPKSGGER
jgi:hypothetical protein